MKKLLMVLMLCSFAIAGVALAHGSGHTMHQMERAGWDCIQAGPHSLEHCSQTSIASQIAAGAESITVKVYHRDTHEFIKTELLLRADLYAGQPYPTEGLDEWTLLPFGYYACHH